MLIFEGIPLLYLELSVGQRLKKGSLVAWSMISPYMGGIGLASVVICIFTGSYYSIVISWCLYYLFNSFRSNLPWSKCPTKQMFNLTSNRSYDIPVPECDSSSSISYFFFRETLNVSESIDETTTWNWKITLCYITAWIVIYVCVIRGIKSSGKVRIGYQFIPSKSLHVSTVGIVSADMENSGFSECLHESLRTFICETRTALSVLRSNFFGWRRGLWG